MEIKRKMQVAKMNKQRNNEKKKRLKKSKPKSIENDSVEMDVDSKLDMNDRKRSAEDGSDGLSPVEKRQRVQ